MSLDRFHQAQDGCWAGFETALGEMRRGRKSSHWIWYVFPQLDGLGQSPTARDFALRDLAEACAYLRDPLLRARYETIVAAVGEQINRGIPIEDLMGGTTDALKLVSSLTLFRAAAERLAEDDPAFTPLAQLCDSILERTARQGYPPCGFTLAHLARNPA